ncbi:uncharacterized protein LOC132562028 [Ylistrum balloti]|uniref:uncharacterized protein LOC132562028 n=1 Tax=Ylistrum balloti TaxID=509963 RepID=UPI002905EE8E|nr:uncharacterized protein LOC132562028 [Ylistrum balloti]
MDTSMDSQDSVAELLTHAIDFANVMSYSVDTVYKPIAEEAVAYGKRLNVDVVKCGSHAERMYLPYFSRSNDKAVWATDASTDIDMMFVFDNYSIVSDIQTQDKENILHINQYQLVEAKHPGYYYMLPITVEPCEMSQIQQVGLSSETLKMQLESSIMQNRNSSVNLLFMEKPTLNGPSVTFQSRANSGVMISIDCVFGVKCSSWPRRLEKFFTRVENCDWPGSDILKDIRDQGCHLVAIGSHGSVLRPYEWRLSSTRAERMLALSLSAKQRLAYQIVKSMIKSHEKTKCISSYYIKTALFWLCEERHIDVWAESTNLQNVKSLLQKVLQFVSNKNVPNYFIEENNLVDHFEDEMFAQANEGLLELCKTLLQGLAQLLELVSVMPVEFQHTPKEMVTSGNSRELLEYLCVNFCFASMVYTISSQIENKTHVNYLFLAEAIFKHLTSSSQIGQIDTFMTQVATGHSLLQTPGAPFKEGWSLSRSGLNSACSLLENTLQYFQAKETDLEVIWKLCTEVANIAATLLHGYCQPTDVGTSVANDCIYLLDKSAQLHHEYAFAYTQKYWTRYPQYRIEPTKNPNKLSYYFLEMWIMILIKYKREDNHQFGRIGRGNEDNMRLPICVRRLVDFMLFYDYDKTWVLLQIDSSLFGGRPIANSLKLRRIEHSSTNWKLDGVINLTKLKLRAKAYKTDKEKCQLQAELGKLWHVKGKKEYSFDEPEKSLSHSQEHFREALNSCPSDVSAKVDLALLLMTCNRFNESLGLLREAFNSEEGGSSVNTYDLNTYRTLLGNIQEFFDNKFPVVIPTLLLACYYVLAIHKSIKVSRDQSLFDQLLVCLKEAISTSDDKIQRFGRFILAEFLSH